MGRSQETFGKKEREKKRLKKKQEKGQRKEQRKANATGGDFESMLAYVDENGHIVDTPPDPTKRTKIKAENISLDYSKAANEVEEETELTGKVSFFNDSKGYGFIKDKNSNESYFVHVNGTVDEITEGDKVTFELEKGPRGFNAVKVKKIP
jgi:cold shock CspA family protein